MEEEILDVAADTNAEDAEAANSNENSTEDAVALKAKLDAAEKAKSQLTARAKRAEDELKKFKDNPPKEQSNDPYYKDELRLVASGLSEEEITQARIIAKGKEVSLTEAVKDPMFQAFQTDLKEKERKEKAKLGASRGSGESDDSQDPGLKPDSKREDHIKAFKKMVGKK